MMTKAASGRTCSSAGMFIGYQKGGLSLREQPAYQQLEHNSFEELVNESYQHPVVLVLLAEWLGAADVMDWYIEDLATQFDPPIQFYRQDVEAYPAIAHQLGIKQLPTTLFLKDGEMVDYFWGMMSKKKIAERLRNFLTFKQG